MARGKITSVYHFKVTTHVNGEPSTKYYHNVDELEKVLKVSRPTIFRKLKNRGVVYKLQDYDIEQGKYPKFKQILVTFD